MLPSASIERSRGADRARSRSSQPPQVSRSLGIGLLAGGAQRTAATIRIPVSDQPVPARHAGGLAGIPGAVEGGVQPVAAPVTGEHAPRPVAAVGRGREPDDEDAGVRVAEARRGPAPVRLVGERRAFPDRGHGLPPGDEPRAGPAHRDLRGQRGDVRRGGGELGDVAGITCDGGMRRRRVPGPAGTGRYRRGERLPGHRVRQQHFGHARMLPAGAEGRCGIPGTVAASAGAYPPIPASDARLTR